MDMTAALIELSNKASLAAIELPEARAFAETIVAETPWPKGVKPYRFQEVGIAYAAISGFRCIIGDAMGLGKTVQAIGCLNLGTRLKRPLTPALVVAPASVTGEWVKALRHFGVGFDVVNIESGTEPPLQPRKSTVYVTSWNLLKSVQDYQREMKLQTLILDESQTAKEPKAQCTRAAMRMARGAPYIIELSGTPAPNRVRELWTQLWMLDPETFEGMEDFDTNVRDVLPAYMVRRLKTDVLAELPPKTRVYRNIELGADARAAYDAVEASLPALVSQSLLKRQLQKAAVLFRKAKKQGAPARMAAAWAVERVNADQPSADDIARAAMVRIGHLRRAIGVLKVPEAIKFVKEHRKKHSDPLVIFVEHRKPLRELGKLLSRLGIKWSCIHGGTRKRARTRRVAAFQAGRIEVLICTQAAYSGITLTRAHRMCFVERWWVPSREEQAEDRIHRIGQTKNVEVTYLMAEETIDEQVHALVDLKRQTLAELMGEEHVREREGDAESIPSDLTWAVTRRLMQTMQFEVDTTVSLGLLRAYLTRKQPKRRSRRRNWRR
jgi:SNF2 family DNA or RNA helicase